MNSIHQRLYEIFDAMWRKRYIILIPALMMPPVGFLVGSMSAEKYQSHTSMLIQETSMMNPFLEDLAVSAMLKERMEALRTLLHSRHILSKVASERGMIDNDTNSDEHDRIIGELSSRLNVTMAGKDLIRIDYVSDTPEGMKETLEIVSTQFIEQLLAPERSSIEDSEKFLSDHLAHRREELDNAEAELAAFKDAHAAELPELHLANISRLSQLKQRLSEKEAELAGAMKQLGGMDQQLSQSDPVLGRIEEQIVRMQSELAIQRAKYTDKHSSIQSMLRKLERLKQERTSIMSRSDSGLDFDKLWDIAASVPVDTDGNRPLLISQIENIQIARSNVDGLQEETRRLSEMVVELEALTDGYGDTLQQLTRLERDLNVKRELYEDLLHRHEKARITGSLGYFERDKRIKVIDKPFTPSRPTNLPRYLFIIAGLFGGLALGGGMALVLELGDNLVRRRDRLEQISGLPVITRIPCLNTNTGATR